jgi:RNA polymerase sigma factor (sigma-70 family)
MTEHRSTAAAQPGDSRPDLSAETDDDLLVYITWKQDDPAVACEAWAEFYRRHVNYLFGVCYQSFGNTLKSRDRVADLVTDTFKRVYEHADSFKPSGIKDPEAMRKRVRAWLGTIARRLFLDRLPATDDRPAECQLEQDHWQNIAQPEAPDDSDNPLIAAVKMAFQKVLTQREQEVMRVTLHWYDPSSDHQRLPNEVAAELAKHLGTTPENLRKIRERALAKLKDEIIKILGSSPFER